MNGFLWVLQVALALVFALSGTLKLPGLTGIAPILIMYAAIGVIVLMALAIVVHERRGEVRAMVVNAALLSGAAFVAWARFGSYAL